MNEKKEQLNHLMREQDIKYPKYISFDCATLQSYITKTVRVFRNVKIIRTKMGMILTKSFHTNQAQQN